MSAWKAPRTEVLLVSSAAVERNARIGNDAAARKADIPIVQLNPGGVLNQKYAGETALRASGAAYTILRPVGASSWPPALKHRGSSISHACQPLLAISLSLTVGSSSCPQPLTPPPQMLLKQPCMSAISGYVSESEFCCKALIARTVDCLVHAVVLPQDLSCCILACLTRPLPFMRHILFRQALPAQVSASHIRQCS